MGVSRYHGNLSGFITLCISLVAVLGASVPCTAESLSLQGPELGIAGQDSIVDLVLDRAPGGLSGYIITLHLADGEAATFSRVEFPDWAGLHETSPLPSPAIWIKAVDTGQGAEINGSGIVLARFSISCEKDCPLAIELDAVRIDTETGDLSLVGPTTAISTEEGEVVATTIAATAAPSESGFSGSEGGSGGSGSGASVTIHVTREVVQTKAPIPRFTQGTLTVTPQSSPVTTPATTRTSLHAEILTILGITIAAGIIAQRR